jgi:hypothetical protein
MKPNMDVTAMRQHRLKAIPTTAVSVNIRVIATHLANNSSKRNYISSVSGPVLEASLGILTRRGNWPGTTGITKRKTLMGKPQLPSQACKRSQTPTLVAMETVGPPIHSHPYLLTMVLGMWMQVKFGSSNPRATTTASRRNCFRGNQVDEVALSIWSTQTYKRYVRSKMTDGPGGRVDRLFVPPNMADAISNAVFNGRHGDAAGMLRELWHPFGLEGMPRLLVVLAKHRSDASHWVVHRSVSRLARSDTTTNHDVMCPASHFRMAP